MNIGQLKHFDHIWVFDFEYVADEGETPDPVCMVAIDLVTRHRIELWRDELHTACPFDTGRDSLFVVYSGTGDLGCFLELDWPLPKRIVDLYPESRQLFYDTGGSTRASLLRTAQYFNIITMEGAAKDAARDLIIDRRFTDTDRRHLLDYCAEDVVVTGQLFTAMFELVTESLAAWNGVLLRGRYTAATARIERAGVPIDTDAFFMARRHWDSIRERLIAPVDKDYDVFEGTSFRRSLFEKYLARQGISWPRLESGQLDLGDRTFRKQAAAHPQLASLRELRHALSGMKLASYTIGDDGRNRVWLNPYGSVSGRNQPSNSKFIFGSARWSRSFIRPEPGHALIYCDWSNQEIAVCAALSGDAALWDAYCSGDPYLAFAIAAGLAPTNASKKTHPVARRRAKAIVLGIGYGMGVISLARDAGIHLDEARELLQRHRDTYRKFWAFVEKVQDAGSLSEPLRTRFHWTRRVKLGASDINRRSFQNWPAQANGAEMMRLAACMLTESGIEVCCPVHDAFLLHVPLDSLSDVATIAARIMGDASEIVLGDGYRVRVDAAVTRYPASYVDENAGDLFTTVMTLAREAEASLAAAFPSRRASSLLPDSIQP